MNQRLYVVISGSIFFLVGVFHLLRLVYHWPILVAGWSIPYCLSCAGFPAATAYAVWAVWTYRQLRRT